MRSLLSRSLDRYYHALSKTGYRSHDVVLRLLMLCAMAELPSRLSAYIGKCEARLLDDAAHRLFDHCVIRPPSHDDIAPNPLGLLGESLHYSEPKLYIDDPDGEANWNSEPCRRKPICKKRRDL